MIFTIRNLSVTGLLALTALLGGCLESGDVIIFEPGVYQGATDPLVGNTDTAALESRFSSQMDR